jgi:hypothetical protein
VVAERFVPLVQRVAEVAADHAPEVLDGRPLVQPEGEALRTRTDRGTNAHHLHLPVHAALV